MIVPPGTASSAAARTLSAAVPVRSFSPGPCVMSAGATAAALDPFALDEELAACASWLPARTPPAIRPAPSSATDVIQRRDAAPAFLTGVVSSISVSFPRRRSVASVSMLRDGPWRDRCTA